MTTKKKSQKSTEPFILELMREHMHVRPGMIMFLVIAIIYGMIMYNAQSIRFIGF